MPDESFFWYSPAIYGVQIGHTMFESLNGKTAGYTFGKSTFPCIYDTGTSFIYIPDGHGYDLSQRLTRGKTYYYDQPSGLTIVSCSEYRLYEDVLFWI